MADITVFPALPADQYDILVSASNMMRTNYIEIVASLPENEIWHILRKVDKGERFIVPPPTYAKEGFKQYKRLSDKEKIEFSKKLEKGANFLGRDDVIDYLTNDLKLWYEKMVAKAVEVYGPAGSIHESDDDEPVQAPPKRRRVPPRQAALEAEVEKLKQENINLRKYFFLKDIFRFTLLTKGFLQATE
jgi:hypothetical protein